MSIDDQLEEQGYNIYPCTRLYTNGDGEITTLSECMNKSNNNKDSVGFNYSKESVCELAFPDNLVNNIKGNSLNNKNSSNNKKLFGSSNDNFLNTDEISLPTNSNKENTVTLLEQTLPYYTAYLKNDLGETEIISTKCYNNPNYTLYSFWGPITFIIFLIIMSLVFFLIVRQQQKYLNF
jgi:hypothetical protein